MRFTTRILLLQILAVAAVTAVCTGVFLFFAVEQLKADAENSALSIARTVAAQPEIRAEVARQSPGADAPDALRSGAIQAIASSTSERTGALFVVVTDDEGLRLAHPDGQRLGERVSTDYEEALAGREVIAWERGTLGESARAKVPVLPPEGGAPVGEVSVGFERASVFDDLPALLLGIGAAAALALGIGVVTAVLLRRRLERLTLGLQPEELTGLVQEQAAVLEGVDDGVLAVDEAGIVRVANAQAERLLGLSAPQGSAADSLGLSDAILSLLRHPGSLDGLVLGTRVLYLDAHPVTRKGRPLGVVLIVRDRTDLLALSERLETVRSMTQALRVQRHEFANRMHVATGLLDAERLDEARDFLAEMSARGPADDALVGRDLLAEPFLASFLAQKALEAAEREVTLTVGPDTLVLGALAEPEDVATVLGNLVENAVAAAAGVRGPGSRPSGTARVVEVTLMDSGETLAMVVADSGPGIEESRDVFAGASADDGPGPGDDRVHGHGIGLRLSRELVWRHEGDLWVIERSGARLGGAVFGVRLPGVMRRRADEERGNS